MKYLRFLCSPSCCFVVALDWAPLGSLVFWLTLMKLAPRGPSILFALAPLGPPPSSSPPLTLPPPPSRTTSLSLTWTGCQSSQTAGQRVAKSAQLPGKLGGQAEGRKHRLSLKVGCQWISGSWTSKGGPPGFPSCLGRSSTAPCFRCWHSVFQVPLQLKSWIESCTCVHICVFMCYCQSKILTPVTPSLGVKMDAKRQQQCTKGSSGSQPSVGAPHCQLCPALFTTL